MDAIATSATGGNVARLVEQTDYAAGHELAFTEIADVQIAAMNERLRQQVAQVKLVDMRARDEGITAISCFEDVAPLLLPHTVYKSYPESFLRLKKWDRLTKWLGTMSTATFDTFDLEGIADIDEWVERLAEAGHFLSCSSGTTGNPALMLSNRADVEFASGNMLKSARWATELQPEQDRTMFAFSVVTQTPKGKLQNAGMSGAFARPDGAHFRFPVPAITIGSIMRMITLRKAVADGTASPSEIAEYDSESATRQKLVDEAVGKSADALIAARGEKLYITGMWAQLFAVADEVRKRGYSARDFHPENCLVQAGGLKGAVLPDDFREVIYDTLNITPQFLFQFYSMQEIQTTMPKCHKGARYHIPPSLVCLPLDHEGEKLLPGIGEGKVEGRAGFFDLSIEGRWGGIITGDRIEVDYTPCPCGARSPSITDNIARFKDLEGDDKITCSGTLDAYVRGVG
jgi:hypothetical protein